MASPRSRSSGTPTPLQRRGAAGEDQACAALMEAGLVPVARNVRYRSGEIDLIMRDGRTLVFVEVRWRAGSSHGGALASIDARKQARVSRAAQTFLLQIYGNRPPPCRFDVVVMDGQGRLEWLRAAW